MVRKRSERIGGLIEQVLPRLQKMLAAEKRKSLRIVETSLAEQLDGGEMQAGAEARAREMEMEDQVALALQPLLEQEAQLE